MHIDFKFNYDNVFNMSNSDIKIIIYISIYKLTIWSTNNSINIQRGKTDLKHLEQSLINNFTKKNYFL